MIAKITWINLIVVLSVSFAAYAEFQVNTYTSDDQQYPAVAMDANGNFVVVWECRGRGDSYGQRFAADNTPIGDEFQINPGRDPDLAMDEAGNFVVVYQADDGSYEGIYARRYDANGQALGDAFLVNSYTDSRQVDPSVAMNDNGAFVVVWVSYYHSTHQWFVRGQLYDAAGTGIGGEFIVSEEALGFPPCVAMDNSGDFTVAFQASPSYTLWMRRYDATANPKGPAFDIAGALYARTFQSIGMAGDGDFVITWHYDPGPSFPDPNVYARRFDSDGNPLGPEFLVNTNEVPGQWRPSVAMNDNGEFVIIWDNGADISGQQYDSNGAPVGDMFQVNTYIIDSQKYSDVVITDSGEFVVVWQSDGQDESGYGIFGDIGPIVCCADFSGDMYVNFRDFCTLAEEWMLKGNPLESDLIDDNKINPLDLDALSQQWLRSCYQCELANVWPMDSIVNWQDYALLVKDWKKQGPLDGDVTGNGTVDWLDLQALAFWWLENCETVVRKPNIYLYPEQTTNLSISISFPNGVSF